MRERNDTPLGTPTQSLLPMRHPHFQEISDDGTTFILTPSVSGSAVSGGRSSWRALLPALSPLRSGEPSTSFSAPHGGTLTPPSRSDIGGSNHGSVDVSYKEFRGETSIRAGNVV